MSKDLIVRLREAAAQRVASTAMIGADDLIAAADALESQAATPSSHWRAEGAPDPHAGHYDGERAALTMGKLTDDELANGAFMNYDQPLNLAGILAGTHSSPIAWMTAVKDRIRWLSRSLEKSEARLHEVAVACATAEQERDALATSLKDVAVAVVEQVDLFGQRGEVCSFEGSSMIYAETLMELGDKVASVVERHSTDAGADRDVRVDQAPTVEDLVAELKALKEQVPFDASDDRFRDAFDTTLKQGSWPTERLGNSYRSSFSRMAWSVAAGTINRLKLYAKPKALYEQEPVAFLHLGGISFFSGEREENEILGNEQVISRLQESLVTHGKDRCGVDLNLYAHPIPVRELTDKECASITSEFAHVRSDDMLGIARAIERHLKGEGE